MGKFKAIVKRPDEEFGHMTAISGTLENLQKIVEGYIEVVTISEDMVIICNEEGRLRNMEPNCAVAGVEFCGTIIACGFNGDKFDDIPISFQSWKHMFIPGER